MLCFNLTHELLLGSSRTISDSGGSSTGEVVQHQLDAELLSLARSRRPHNPLVFRTENAERDNNMPRAALLIFFGVVIGSAGTIAVQLIQTGDSKLELSSLDASPNNDRVSGSPERLLKLPSEPDFDEGLRYAVDPVADVSIDLRSKVDKINAAPPPRDGEDAAENIVDQLPTDTSNLPDKFKYLVESQPVSSRRLTPQENHAFFSQDTRDEAWAYTMELGIREYLAANQNAGGTIIEHVECRSRMCEIAGVVYPGGNDDFSEHLEVMRGSGWWQLSNSQHSTGAIVDGEYRFVSFIPRNNEDTLVTEVESSICD